MISVKDKVKAVDIIDGKHSVLFEVGTVIYIGRRALVQFDSNVLGHNGNGIGEEDHCWMCDLDKVEKLGG
jgi:hypothetical protein